MARWYEEQLKTPIRGGAVGMTGAESAAKYGLARRQIQGATKTAMEQTKSAMGGKGFRAGESGIADTAMASIASQGAERLGAAATGQAISEIERTDAQRQQQAALNLQRQTGAGQIGVGVAQAGAQAAAARASAKSAADRLAWDREKYTTYTHPMMETQFEYGQEQDAWSRLMSLYGSQAQGQGQAWGQYGQYY